MGDFYTREETFIAATHYFQEVSSVFHQVDEHAFFVSENNRWSPAQHLEHLTKSMKPVNLALRLPKIFLLFFGWNSKSSRSYSEISKTYQATLQQGARSPKAFIPGKNQTTKSKEELLDSWKKEASIFLNAINNWDEKKLDFLLLPHPLLGKLSVREMIFFTIYHSIHHAKSVESMYK